MTITSRHNPRLQEVRRLGRKREREREGRFVAEGEDLVAAAQRAGWPAVAGYRSAGSELGGPHFQDVSDEALAAVSSLGSGTRVIGVYDQRWLQKPAGPLCVHLEGVGDPGNVGTVLRGALAFGAASVSLGPGCADPYSAKAVRASMGAIFLVGLARAGDVRETPGERVALVAGAGQPLADVAARLADSPQVTLVIGAERTGLPENVLAACPHVASIPIVSESLNAAMAATVALYETTRTCTRVRGS